MGDQIIEWRTSMPHHNLGRRLRKAAGFVIAANVIAIQAHASVGTICLELPPGAGNVKAEIASGCLPTSPGHKGAFTISVDADRAVISIVGQYKPSREQRIGTTDCMGSQTITQVADAAGPRRYSVMVNGTYRGVIDASDTVFGMRSERQCFAGPSQTQRFRPERVTTYTRAQFADWIARPRGKPKDALYRESYASPGAAAAALLGSHPEGLEGRQSAKITISLAQWRGKVFQKPPKIRFLAVSIEEHGYLDDSVSGKRSFAELKQNSQTGEWRITGHWYQFMCVRGQRAGQWSARPCP